MKVCIVTGRGCPGNVKHGEYVCLPPRIADAYARQGSVALLTETIKGSEVIEAGSLKAFLKANPKARVMPVSEEKALLAGYRQQGLVPPAPAYDRVDQGIE